MPQSRFTPKQLATPIIKYKLLVIAIVSAIPPNTNATLTAPITYQTLMNMRTNFDSIFPYVVKSLYIFSGIVSVTNSVSLRMRHFISLSPFKYSYSAS